MPKTAVVNPRRKRRKSKSSSSPRRRRRNPEENPRRRRRGKRRYYGGARRARRRNPGGGASLARSSSRPREKNGIIGITDTIHVLPAATAGVWAARWAVAQAGEFEEGEPGFKHALAIWLAASFGGDIIGSLFGGAKGVYAQIAALGFGGDLFMRKRFLKDSKWVAENISLMGIDDTTNLYAQGATYNGMGADSFTDALGNRYVQTSQGWALAGEDDGPQQLYQDEAGNIFQLPAGIAGFEASSAIGGFESTTAIGALTGRRASADSSFGYA